MKTLLTLILLLTLNISYSKPPEWANNPDEEEMPEQAQCSFCDDEEDLPIPYLWVLGIAGLAYAYKRSKQLKY